MKRVTLLLCLLAIGTIVFTGCKKEGCTDPEATNYDADAKDDDGSCIYPDNQLPQITDFKINGASATSGDHKPGDSVMINFVASDAEGLSSYEIQEQVSGATLPTTVDEGDISGGSSNVSYNYVVSATAAIGSIITLTSIVIDEDLDSASTTYSITVISSMVDYTGQFYHVEGTLKGAYDLDQNVEISAGGEEADKDMRNYDGAGNPFTGSWQIGNSTTYVKDNAFDYGAATPSTAAAAYNAGGVITDVMSPADGDIYIANLRGNNDYVVIKITNNDENDNTCSCGNLGILEFKYKKSN
ncbi:MAG: hypothetical protein IH946_01145 [Bacteroidetes bacterium]|nr:hypothetical protein [Bacteroidota bacterium]